MVVCKNLNSTMVDCNNLDSTMVVCNLYLIITIFCSCAKQYNDNKAPCRMLLLDASYKIIPIRLSS